MIVASESTAPSLQAGSERRRATVLVALAYLVFWAAGLLLGGPELSAAHGGEAIAAAFDGNLRALTQSVLVHGLAGLAVGALAVLLAQLRLEAGGARSRSRLLTTVGLAATALSLLQLAGELLLTTASPSADQAHTVWVAITVTDGVKMLALAAVVFAALPVAPRTAVAWVVTVLAGLTSVALVASGIGYLLLATPLMAAAFLSLPLLLIWAISIGILASRSVRLPTGIDA